MMRRSLALFLCLVTVLSAVPVSVLAREGCDHHTEHDAACGYVQSVEGVPCGHVCGEGCPTKEVTACVHDHAALGCGWVEASPAVYCGHTCGDGSCSYAPAVAGVDCTCTPYLLHQDGCASYAEGACDCAPVLTHQDTCSPVEAVGEIPCDFVHTDCGCAAAVEAHWDCAHSCTADSGCVKNVCTHVCPGDSCGYVPAVEAKPCAYSCEICDPTEPEVSVKTVTAWSWVDPDGYLTKGELALPGANEAQVASSELILSMLPGAISTEEYGEIPVSFSCDSFPTEGAYQGSYLFTASLAEGYVLADTAVPLTVTVILGQGDSLAGNSFTSGSWKYSVYVGANQVTIDGYTGSSKNPSIPTTLGGYNVVAISSYAFEGSNITAITIPSHITKINGYAFYNCKSLQSVTISGSPTCDYNTFSGCSSLTKVNLGSIPYIPGSMFDNCTSLDSITIPNSVTSIGQFAFSNCPLSTVSFASTSNSKLTSIAAYAFSNCEFSTIKLPKNAQLTAPAFFNCRNLASITVDSGSTIYKSVDGVLYNKSGSKLIVYPRAKIGESYQVLPGTLTIDKYAFLGYAATLSGKETMLSLKKVYLPPSIKNINDYAFRTSSITGFYFCGNVPTVNYSPFDSGTAYYSSTREGWPASLGRIPTAVWPDEEHFTEEGESFPATCGEPGYSLNTCKICGASGKVYHADVPATGNHRWGVSYSNTTKEIRAYCQDCTLEGTAKLSAPTARTYTGEPIEAVVTGSIPEEFAVATLTYTGNTTDGKPVNVGTYTATLKASYASVSVSYTITKAPETKPAARIDYAAETLTGLTPNGGYTINGVQHTASADGTITIDSAWFGTTVSVVKTASDANHAVSAPQSLAIASRPAKPTGIGVTAETTAGKKDGSITGVTTTMEYRKSGEEGWTAITSNAVTGLESGNYEVRIQATDSAFAGEIETVTIDSLRKALRAEDIVISAEDFTYNGSVQTPTILFPEDLDSACVTVRYLDSDGNEQLPVDAGSYSIVIDISGSDVYGDVTGISDAEWSYSIAQERIELTAEPIADQTYTGSPLEPAVQLGAVGDKRLVKDQDYTVSYSENINVGTATVTLSPVAGSNYSFESKEVSFRILPCPISMDFFLLDTETEYSGLPKTPVPSIKFEGTPGSLRPEQGRDYSISYANNINAGTATITIAPIETGNYIFKSKEVSFTILPKTIYLTVAPIADRVYNGSAHTPQLDIDFNSYPVGHKPQENVDYTITYENNTDAGTATVTIAPAAENGNLTFKTRTVNFAILQCPVTVTIDPIAKQLYTGSPVEPAYNLTFTGVPEGKSLEEGTDYEVTFSNNVAAGEATVAVSTVNGSNYAITEPSTAFTISYGVKVEDIGGILYVDGVAKTVEDGILWLDDENAKLITTYDHANAGAEDIHTVYPTAMYVWELRFTAENGYSISRVTELDNALQYSGTSIRITGNQGIRFITSVPAAKKSALTGSGLAGYKLVEYGTLMGWYEPGRELLYGVNAKSIAYDRTSGTDQVFNRTGDLCQFTGMLTDLELEQSTRDLMTRPYMVLERTDAAGQTEQVVLYGGSITRSIGYVAYQNKDVFQPGSSSYEFIWKILSYAYPDLYEAEYKG